MEFSVRRGAVIFGLFLLIAVTETSGRPSARQQNREKNGQINRTRQDRNKTYLNCTPLIKPVSNFTNLLNSSIKNPISFNKRKLERKFGKRIPKKLGCSNETECVVTMSKRLTYLRHCLQHLNNSGKGRLTMRSALSQVIPRLQDLNKNLPVTYKIQTDGLGCEFKVKNADEADEYAQFFSEKLLDNLKKFGCQEEKQDRSNKKKEKKKGKGGKESTEGRKRKGRRQKKTAEKQ